MELLQCHLKIYRLKNQNPRDTDKYKESHKYQYQLFRNNELITSRLSDSEFSMGEVFVSPGTLKMELVKNTSELNFREMEANDIFLVNIVIVN